ncbi:MAG TPA: sugar phosphate nucleotidyltransferase [Candidatus Sulfotelmatobacter sp.]|nr:sugar phosphate nucleotidyltransferase [Candidatus Sulfotelmatobacter sp.]
MATADVERAAGPEHAGWAVVLAGGEGRRMRRFIGKFLGSERPKQFCRIVGRRSMLRHTWDRAARVVEAERIVTVITAGQEPYLDEEAGGGVPGTVLVQPENKETAAGLLLPLLWIARRAPAATVAVFPADHFVWEEDRFAGHVRTALAAAQERPERLVLLGVEADGPEVGYGWIAPGEPLAAGPAAELYTVRRFWEKPDLHTAARLFGAGHLWNTLVLAGHMKAFLGLAAACIPQVFEPLRAVGHLLDGVPAAAVLAATYRRIPSTNFSRAILARSPKGLTVLAVRGVGWSDWGDPDRIVRTLRRFQRRPGWLSAYALAQAQAATSRASRAA